MWPERSSARGYTLGENSRVEDAVDAAGGFVVEADKNALNLAAHLEDGERLDIPYVAGFIPDEAEGFVVITEGTPSPLAGEGLVDINTASLEELDNCRASAQPSPSGSSIIARGMAHLLASMILSMFRASVPPYSRRSKT
jgi:hypothetical protein